MKTLLLVVLLSAPPLLPNRPFIVVKPSPAPVVELGAKSNAIGITVDVRPDDLVHKKGPIQFGTVTAMPLIGAPGPKPAGEGWGIQGGMCARNDEWELLERRERQLQRLDVLIRRLEELGAERLRVQRRRRAQ